MRLSSAEVQFRSWRTPLLAVALLGWGLSACGETAFVEVGTGAIDFEPLAPEGSLEIECGPQGGSHLWAAVRAQGIGYEGVEVSVRIVNLRDGSEVCRQSYHPVDLDQKQGWGEFTGIPCLVMNPAALIGEHLQLTGSIREKDRVTESQAIPFYAQNFASNCNQPN